MFIKYDFPDKLKNSLSCFKHSIYKQVCVKKKTLIYVSSLLFKYQYTCFSINLHVHLYKLSIHNVLKIRNISNSKAWKNNKI